MPVFGDMSHSQLNPLPDGKVRNVRAVQKDAAAFCREKSGKRIQQLPLSVSVHAGNADNFPGTDVQRKIAHLAVSHIVFHADAEISKDVCNINEIEEFRPATDLERLNFFNLMAEEGKMWDAENKKVVDYPMWDIRKGGNHESEN